MDVERLNAEIDHLKKTIDKMERARLSLEDSLEEQEQIYKALQFGDDEELREELREWEDRDYQLWCKLLRLDKTFNVCLSALLAYFPSGENEWRDLMEKRYPGYAAKIDELCDYMEDVYIKALKRDEEDEDE